MSSSVPINYSIIIPHKDIPELLVRCLDSIPEREDIQVVVVDDCSRDFDVFLNKFPEHTRSRVDIYISKEGKGAGYARNIGLKFARGKWVLFADADDFFLPGWLTVTDRYLDTDADVIQFRIDDVLNKDDCGWHNKKLDKYRDGQMTARDVLLTNVTCWAKMLRLDFLRKNQLTFEEVRFGNDVLFGVKVAVHASAIMIVQKPIYDVTYREGSLTTIKNADTLRCRFEAQKRADAYASKFGFKQFELPCAIDHLKTWREFGLRNYLHFVWKERKEIKRAKKIRLDTKPFNFRHPYLYVILVLFRFL